jgi:hypothetical protein
VPDVGPRFGTGAAPGGAADVVELPDCTFEKSGFGFSSSFFPNPSKMPT